MSEYVHKRHNVSVLIYHIVCPAKYRRVVFDEKVERVVRDICLEISPAVENRARLFLTRQFPATGRALGSPDYGLSRVFPSGLSDYYAEAVMKPVLVVHTGFISSLFKTIGRYSCGIFLAHVLVIDFFLNVFRYFSLVGDSLIFYPSLIFFTLLITTLIVKTIAVIPKSIWIIGDTRQNSKIIKDS
jgi:hypothetical protein